MAAADHAAAAFTQTLGKAVGTEGIRVNAMRQDLISIEMQRVHGGIAKMELITKTAVPLGRAGSAAEVAPVALWLASDAAFYVHGTAIDVAGGR